MLTLYVYWKYQTDARPGWEVQRGSDTDWIPGTQDDSTEQIIATAAEYLPPIWLAGDVVVERNEEPYRDQDITKYLGGESMHQRDVVSATETTAPEFDITAITEDELLQYCTYVLGLSQFAYRDQTSKYHAQCALVAAECLRRGRRDIYSRAYKVAFGHEPPKWPVPRRICAPWSPCTPECWQQTAAK